MFLLCVKACASGAKTFRDALKSIKFINKRMKFSKVGCDTDGQFALNTIYYGFPKK